MQKKNYASRFENISKTNRKVLPLKAAKLCYLEIEPAPQI
jgi:hypothetical protein